MAREKGQGSVVPTKTPKGADRWRIAVTMADGRRVWRTARTPREAERIRRQLVEARELDLDPTRQTLGAWLRSWIAGLRDARNQRVRPRTLDHYELIVERHIIPALGSLKLAAVTGRRVQAWLDADPAAPRTVLHHHAVLRRALNVAVRQRLLPYNPASAVELPRARVSVAAPLTLPEVRALLAATRGDRLHALWRLAIVTGLRQGELLGLAWDDVDGATITVSAQLQRIVEHAEREAAAREGRKPVGTWLRTPPKAARKLLSIAIDPETAAVLDEHRLLMAAERTPEWTHFGHVFVDQRGRPFHSAAVEHQFHAACDAAGIPRRRFHDMRHSSAHLLSDLGVTMEARKARLGHTTDRMAAMYSGASEAQDRIAVDRLGEAIGGAG
jgi:integrase